MAPGLPHQIVGIRPGEKLHEVMCPGDDSHLTLEFGDHYVIKPSIQFSGVVDFSVNRLGERGPAGRAGLRVPLGQEPAFPDDRGNRRPQSQSPTCDSVRPPGRHAGRHRRGRRRAAVGLPHAGSGRPPLRGGRREPRECAHAVAVNSATSALHIACLALGLGPGDLLWTVPNTFVASANCAPLLRRRRGFRRHRPVYLEPERGGAEGEAGRGAPRGRLPKVVVPGALRRPADRAGSDLGAGPGIRLQGPRGRLACDRRVAEWRAGRQLPVVGHHRVQLSPGQDHHDGRRRHGAHERRGDWPSAWPCCARTASRAIRRAFV